MKIEFSRTGGFAAPALRQEFEIETGDLPPDDARDLMHLVKNADIGNMTPARPSRPSPDAFRYRVTITEGDVTHTATASDAEMPDTLIPLVDWLTKRATNKS